jgi:hypothetical protein
MACSRCGGTVSSRAPRSGAARAPMTAKVAPAPVSVASDCGCECSCESGPATWPCSDAIASGLVRTRFYDGMALAASDLADEQQYWRIKRRLTNRALGSGVVWGLRTEWRATEQIFVIGPGYGLDCCGNDVVVPDCVSVPAGPLLDRRNSAIAKLLGSGAPAKPKDQSSADVSFWNAVGRAFASAPRQSVRAHLMLKYAEQPSDPKPASGSRCPPAGERWEASRIREGSVLCIVPLPTTVPDGVADAVDDLQALRKSLPEAEQAVLFPPDEPLEAGAPLSMRIRVSDDEVVVDAAPAGTERWIFPVGVAAALVTAETQGTTRVQFELRAPPGQVFVSGRVVSRAAQGATLASVEAPFALRLIWSVELPLDDEERFESFEALDLRVTPLFSRERQTFKEVKLVAMLRVAPRDQPPSGGGPLVQISVVANDDQQSSVSGPFADPPPPVDPDCAPVAPWLLAGRGGDDARMALLGTLYGWLAGSMNGATGEMPWSGERVAAHWAVLIAWRLLFGANAATQDAGATSRRTELAELLAQLLKRWCYGFVYPGPRCTEHHGVVLGTLTLSSGGTVLGFDPWDGRRHVWTGPLFEHWLGQLSMAPLDVVVGRLVSAICCASSGPTRVLPALPALAAIASTGSAISSTSLGRMGVMLGGGSVLAMATDDELQAALAADGLREWEVRDHGMLEVVGQLAGALARPPRAEADRGYVRYRVTGQTGVRLHLLVPADEESASRFAARADVLRRMVEVEVERASLPSLGALGDAAFPELLVRLARIVELRTHDISPGAPAIRLRAANEASLGGVLGQGPDAVRTRWVELGGSGDVAELNKFWAACVDQLRELVQVAFKAVQTWQSEADKPFSRDAFSDSRLAKALADTAGHSSSGRVWISEHAAEAVGRA